MVLFFTETSAVCGVRCAVCSVWCAVYHVRCAVCDVRCVVYGEFVGTTESKSAVSLSPGSKL